MKYAMLDTEKQVEALKSRLAALELEHFGIVRGYTSVDSHVVVHQEGESTEDAVKRLYNERRPVLEAEITALQAELEELENG